MPMRIGQELPRHDARAEQATDGQSQEAVKVRSRQALKPRLERRVIHTFDSENSRSRLTSKAPCKLADSSTDSLAHSPTHLAARRAHRWAAGAAGCASLDEWQRQAIFDPRNGSQRWFSEPLPGTEQFDVALANGHN